MKNKTKVALIIAIATLAVALLAVAILAITLLVGGNKAEAITIREKNLPRQVYVIGQSLDLDDGLLTVSTKDGNELINLSSPDIKVSGYDKNKEGKQTITVEYDGQTTSFEVVVYPRIQAENVEVGYFIGDEFNANRGKLKITKDDGTQFTVALDDEAITITGFDSSVEKLPLTLTATYSNGIENYTGTFTVNVYGINNVTFKAPTKINYYSYEEELDVSGGYFTVKSNDGVKTKNIQITEDMTSGFDLSLATEANIDTPLEQTIKVTYQGKTEEFKIFITYSNVSKFRELADKFNTLDWSGTTAPTIEETVGENAIEAWAIYEGLSEKEKEVLTEAETLQMVRTAVQYGVSAWKTAFSAVSETIIINESGNFLWTSDDYDTALADYNKLILPENKINVLSLMLQTIKEQFGTEVMYGETKVETLVNAIPSAEGVKNVSDMLGFMLELYEAFESVPNGWTVDNIGTHKEAIDATMALIKNSSYVTSSYSAMYDVVTYWRENKDFIDALYAYYYKAEGKNSENIQTLKNIRLPGVLEELFTNIRYAMEQISLFRSGYAFDTTYFMLYYDMCIDLINGIQTGSDTMMKELYENLTFDGLLTIGGEAASVPFDTLMLYLETTQYGYNYNLQLHNDPEVSAIWNKYLDVLYNIIDDEAYVESDAYAEDIEELFTAFVEQTPSIQYFFLYSLNVYYPNPITNALDPSEQLLTNFANRIITYYTKALPEGDAQKVFAELLKALESYSRRALITDGMEKFEQSMNLAGFYYEELSDEDEAKFNDVLGFFYEKYTTIYEEYTGTTAKTELGEWQDEFDALADAIYKASKVYKYVQSEKLYYAPLLSFCEIAMGISSKILENAPKNIKNAYLYENIVQLEDGRPVSLDFGTIYAKNLYSLVMRNITVGNEYLYRVYPDYAGLRTFIVDANEFFWDTLYFDEELDSNYDAEYVYSLITAYSNLTTKEQMALIYIDGAGVYSKGLSRFFSEVFASSEKVQTAANNLVALQHAYVNYVTYKEGQYSDGTTTLARITNTYKALVESYKALITDEEKAMFEVLKVEYDKWVKMYKDLGLIDL